MSQTVDYYKYTSSGILSTLSQKMRQTIFDMFMETMKPRKDSTILDVGVTPVSERPESNFFEKLYPYKDKITAASIEDASYLEDVYKGLKFVELDGKGLPFRDNEFDIAFSNAVVEHVGSRDNQKRFVEELIRVSKKCFIAVPYRLFPIEHHTALPLIHYLPQRYHRRLLKSLGKDLYASEERLNLLNRKDFRSLFPPEVKLKTLTIKLFGIPSNIIAVAYKDGLKNVC